MAVWESIPSTAFSALTGLLVGGNAVTYGFALTLGAGDRALGLCAAIPAVMSLGQLVGAWAAPRLKSRRKAAAWASTIARLLWLIPAVLDSVKPPLGFRQLQCIDLSSWNTHGKMQPIDDVLAAILLAQGI